MNGRQGGQRSGAAGLQVHHQRQWSSDNFLESSSNGRWLQSAGLQHLQQSSAAGSIPALQVPIFQVLSLFWKLLIFCLVPENIHENGRKKKVESLCITLVARS